MTPEKVAQPSARLENVSKYYETAAQRVTALEKMNWEISPGQAVALMGPSGCGKTTILNLLGGMDRPTSGGVFAGLAVAHGDHHLGAGGCQRSGGLNPNARCAAGDDHGPAGQIMAFGDFGGVGEGAEACGDPGHGLGPLGQETV